MIMYVCISKMNKRASLNLTHIHMGTRHTDKRMHAHTHIYLIYQVHGRTVTLIFNGSRRRIFDFTPRCSWTAWGQRTHSTSQTPEGLLRHRVESRSAHQGLAPDRGQRAHGSPATTWKGSSCEARHLARVTAAGSLGTPTETRHGAGRKVRTRRRPLEGAEKACSHLWTQVHCGWG